MNLIRVAVGIENIGDVLLRLEKSSVGIQQVVPVADEIRPTVDARTTLVGSTKSEIEWPFIDGRQNDWSGSEIEPGESAAFHFELFASREVRCVLVYSYFRNVTKPGDQGWNTSTLHEIESTVRADIETKS